MNLKEFKINSAAALIDAAAFYLSDNYYNCKKYKKLALNALTGSCIMKLIKCS